MMGRGKNLQGDRDRNALLSEVLGDLKGAGFKRASPVVTDEPLTYVGGVDGLVAGATVQAVVVGAPVLGHGSHHPSANQQSVEANSAEMNKHPSATMGTEYL
jgi:hypothetical protein